MYVQRMETKLLRFKVVRFCYYECHKRCLYIIQLCHIKHTKGLLEAKPEFAVIFAIDADTRQIILPKDIFMVNYWRDNRSKQIVMSQGSCLLQDNLLRGIVNWSSAASSAGQVCQTDLINSFSNNFSLFQLETKTLFYKYTGFPFRK